MPEKTTMRRVAKDRREGKAASTQAGEFVREEMDHIREGKHGARSAKQAIAIGLSKARRAGVALPAPKKGNAKKNSVRRKARADTAAAAKHARPSRKRSRAVLNALRREGHSAASHQALARQARAAARKRSSASKSASARKAARTRKAAEGK
jgi:hypothetical protein